MYHQGTQRLAWIPSGAVFILAKQHAWGNLQRLHALVAVRGDQLVGEIFFQRDTRVNRGQLRQPGSERAEAVAALNTGAKHQLHCQQPYAHAKEKASGLLRHSPIIAKSFIRALRKRWDRL